MDGRSPQSADLGNKLRGIVGQLEERFYSQARLIVQPVEKEMIRLLEASDDAIEKKSILLLSSAQSFPSEEEIIQAVRSDDLQVFSESILSKCTP